MQPKKVSIKENPPTEGGENGNGDGKLGEDEQEKLPPTFEQMWFDDPVEGREAQRLALELRKNVVLRAETMRIYLERTGIVAILLQGLQHMAKARPSDPAEWLAAFLLKNNPRRDMIITPPKIVNSNANPNAKSNVASNAEPKVDSKKKK